MTALEEIKKAFPNMFRPLKWHHFEGPTEHGCGEWYAHATRGMYHIYDVREKFPNDRPFYAKELSDQFDTLELAQEAIQKRHEGDILLGLEPEFLSTLESLQRDLNACQEQAVKDGNEISRLKDWQAGAISCREAEQARVDEYKTRADAAEAEVRRLRNKVAARVLTDAQLIDEIYAVDAVIDAGFGEGGGSPGEWWYERADELDHERKRRELENQLQQHNSGAALASTGGEHNAE